VPFPVRTYTIKAIEDVRPDITRAINSKGEEILPGGTTSDTSITLEGTGTVGQEVEIFDGATSTGKKPKADDKGIWTVELTGLTTTTHLFKAKALYGSGAESEVWTVIVAAPAFLVEDFQSYYHELLEQVGDYTEGLRTKVMLLIKSGKDMFVQVKPSMKAIFIKGYERGDLAYYLALKHESARSATIRGKYEMDTVVRIQLEFLKNNYLIATMPFYEGSDPEFDFERDVAPNNGQEFDTLRFVITHLPSATDNYFVIHTVAFRS